MIRSTKNNAIWHKNPHTIKNGKIVSILDQLINNIEYSIKFTINASENLDISLAYHIFFNKNTFIKNIAIHAQYRTHNVISEDVNTHRKKNDSKKIRIHKFKNSKIRPNRLGLFSNRS